MNLIGRKFQNKSGKICTVKDFNENFTVFSDNTTVETKYLLDKKYFTELPQETGQTTSLQSQNKYSDPTEIFNRSNSLFEQSLFNQINSVVNNLPPNIDYSNNINAGSTVTVYDPEDEKDEISRKYGLNSNKDQVSRRAKELAEIQSNNLLNSQNLAQTQVQKKQFKEMLLNENMPVSDNKTEVIVENVVENSTYNISTVDPIVTMFKKAKRNLNFKLTIEIDEKIPRLDFIEMMEDSYETSIIDYLAQEFTKSIITNPSLIKDAIIEKMKNMLIASQEKTQKKIDATILNEKKETSNNQIIKPTKKTVVKKTKVKELVESK